MLPTNCFIQQTDNISDHGRPQIMENKSTLVALYISEEAYL